MSEHWHGMTALELGAGIEAGAIDPVELAERLLARIAAEDGDGLVFIRLAEERTRAEARAARARRDTGLRRSALDGVPVSWKDLVETAGLETTMATRALVGRVPERDAAVLRRATLAGTVFLGKTNMTEFAFSGLGINTVHGTPANASDPATPRVPGGSSSGAGVAVARGLGPLAIGSDTGGSVRIPAAVNGVVGLKTTIGALPNAGVMPLAPLLDTVGPLAATVADAAAMWSVLSAAAPVDLAGASLDNRLLVAVDDPLWRGLDPGIDEACRAAVAKLEAAGARVVWRDVGELAAVMEVMFAQGGLIAPDAYASWGELVEAEPGLVYPHMLPRFLSGKRQTGYGLLRLMRRLEGLAARPASATRGLRRHDRADRAGSAAAHRRPDRRRRRLYRGQSRHAAQHHARQSHEAVRPHAALRAPDARGLPVGLMLMQRPFREGALLRLGKAVEDALAR